MNSKINPRIINDFIKVVFSVYSLLGFFRVVETALIFSNYGFAGHVLASEFAGLIYDLAGASLPLILYFGIYYAVYSLNFSLVRVLNAILWYSGALVYLLIVKYYLYQLAPLDIFLFKYTLNEILFTVKTSNISLFSTALILLMAFAAITLIIWVVNKVTISRLVVKITYAFIIVSVPLFFTIQLAFSPKINNYTLNKPAFFTVSTVKYLATKNQTDYKNVGPADFHKLYPHKAFVSDSFPLLYTPERNNLLGACFKPFTASPNIVIIIVEGLNDDFIHSYNGAVLMPYLNNLTQKSLYWNRCFTLGERSFAAVPSILGGLPYGDQGFTLQDRLPRHLSLVTELNSNGYYTTFYYGQGAWFHQKDRFFKYNNINLIFDNSKFSTAYEKIIVGADNFFWGYNDKDLFNQSLDVIDTLNQPKRLDVYFTGTSHTPFAITDDNYYTAKLAEYTTPAYREFYATYATFLKSILFVDDALNNFITRYKSRPEYENTVFIITGDHPMTEIPPANSLKRYHVPLIIYSEKLKESRVFSNTASHLDIPEALLAFLADYMPQVPSISTSLGTDLLPVGNPSAKNIAFMNDNREVVDFLSDNYYLTRDELYEVSPDLNIFGIRNDSIKTVLVNKLKAFNAVTNHAVRSNTLIPAGDYCIALNRKNIYEYRNPAFIKSTDEYYPITGQITVPNGNFVIDISLNLTAGKNADDVSVVYQIATKNDSILLWNSFGINSNKPAQTHVPVGKMAVGDSVLYFKSYIWNRNKHEFGISDIDVLIHAPVTGK